MGDKKRGTIGQGAYSRGEETRMGPRGGHGRKCRGVLSRVPGAGREREELTSCTGLGSRGGPGGIGPGLKE